MDWDMAVGLFSLQNMFKFLDIGMFLSTHSLGDKLSDPNSVKGQPVHVS